MHGVVLRTAYRDLKELEKMGLVESHQNGKMVSYMASEKARRLLLT